MKLNKLQRAKELGFTTIAYHGTNQNFNEFDLEKGKPHVLSGYAPHFSNSKEESKGYGGKVLTCLLRIKNPFKVSYDIILSPTQFKKIVGKNPEKDKSSSMDALRELSNIHGWERDKYKDKKMMWTLIYARLKELGYDSIIFPNTPPDYTEQYYDKIVVLDPKNVRLINAKFDPKDSESANLIA